MTDLTGHAPLGERALLTDLYQLAMCQAYWREGMTKIAAFEFFVRRLPRRRQFLIACGLEQVLEFLETLRFSPEDLAWLDSNGKFEADFLQSLAEFKFDGDVDAMPEGTVFFQDEPILRVSARLPEAQFVESRIVNILHFQTLIASKAARMVALAPKAILIDFGMRRAHGGDAALLAARASYIVGFAGSATLEAMRVFGVPCFGTMAHSFIQAHDSEREAFLQFASAFPGNAILLIDTYDTARAARGLPEIAATLAREGIAIAGVRIDSGDLIAESKTVRSILDAGGLGSVKIFASSSVEEGLLAKAVAQGAPIDGYGVGTHLTTSADAPFLDCAYKLQEYAGVAKRKRSPGKETWPGRKQVFRRVDGNGRILSDMVGEADEACLGQPLLKPVMRAGKRVAPSEDLGAIRARSRQNLAILPPQLLALERDGDEPLFRPTISPGLNRLAADADRAIEATRREKD